MHWSSPNDNESWQQHQQQQQRGWTHDAPNHSPYRRALPVPHSTAESWDSDSRLREAPYVPYELPTPSLPPYSRPPIAHAHTYPPNFQPSHTQIMSQAQRPSSSGTGRDMQHVHGVHGYQPYPTAATPHQKKSLLFINAAPTGQDPSQMKPKRKKISPEQLVELCALFDQTDAPSFEQRDKVGRAVGMTNREVQVWFQNRRAKVLREKAMSKDMNPLPVKQDNKLRSQQELPPPLSNFTSRFAATTVEDGSAGSPCWNHTHTDNKAQENVPRAMAPPDPVPVHPPFAQAYPDTYSSHRPQPAQHASLAELPRTQMASPPSQTRSPNASSAPPSLTASSSHHREIFQRVGHPIELPSPQFGSPSPQVSSGGLGATLGPPADAMGYRSPTFPGYSPGIHYSSPFFSALSPSLSSVYSGGPGTSLFSPQAGHSSSYSSPSSYFSHQDAGSSGLYTPAFSSPFSGNGGFRLTLDSPGAVGFSPRSGGHYASDKSPGPQSWDPLNRLPPIVSPVWEVGQTQLDRDRAQATGHRRTHSDQTSDMTRTNGTPVSSDTTSRRSLSPSLTRSPAGPDSDSPGGQHTHRPSDQYRRALTRPSGLSTHSLPSTLEEDDHAEPLPAPKPQSAGVGLGMLATAGEMVEVDESEKIALERYQATRKLSRQLEVSMDG